ncbi:hypothetical protein B0T13DRAFT_480681, partial [Neurospora crassa]
MCCNKGMLPAVIIIAPAFRSAAAAATGVAGYPIARTAYLFPFLLLLLLRPAFVELFLFVYPSLD